MTLGSTSEDVKASTEESGHQEVALQQVGQVLIYSPPDKSGLWINETIAEALDAKDAEHLRRGLRTGFYNSRGVHTIDPTGNPEFQIAVGYDAKAQALENKGFPRVAATMRGLARSYKVDAQRIIEEHRSENPLNPDGEEGNDS